LIIVSVAVFLGWPVPFIVHSIFSICPAIRYVHEFRNCFWVGSAQVLDEVFSLNFRNKRIYCSFVGYVFSRILYDIPTLDVCPHWFTILFLACP
jgi:hypothetical protein